MAKSNKSRPETKKAALEREYKRVRKNYVERIRYYSNKTGLDLKSLIPKKPKRITEASIRRLKSQTGKEILKKAKKIKKLKAKEELEKKSPTKKKSSETKESYIPQKSSIILDNCIKLLNDVYNIVRGVRESSRHAFEKHHDALLSYLNHEIDKYGRDGYAQILEKIGEPFLKTFETLVYTYDDYKFYSLLEELNTLVYGGNMSMSDSLELAQIADAQQAFVEYG
jgi:predicted ArsR family transcriptional regulator